MYKPSCLVAGRLLRALFATVSVFVFAAVAHATIGAALQIQLGNPSQAATDPDNHLHYLIERDQYALDYNDTTHEPNWVSWDLTVEDVGSSGRSTFIQDTTLPTGFYQVLTTDYSGSGYDRGHMCPSADRTVTVYDNQQVFYMSNMVPQSPDNNQGVWANFESYCRSLASAGNEVLITCGPSGFGGSTIASGVAIPGYTWKIAVVVPRGSGSAVDRITPSTRVIAIKVPNIAGVRSTPWQNFVTSVAQIEADTGYQFFSALPDATANALRVEVDGQSAVGSPAIVAQPVDQTTVVGGSATFSVTTTGDAPLSYQWRKDDVELAGATNASLTITGVTAGDVGSYDVVVTNSVGSVTSNAASLIVMGLAPSITTSPASQAVNAGSNVTFAVEAAGSPVLSYQWRKDGAPIAFATTATLTLANVQAADVGAYDVVVTNSVSTATSSAANLGVNPAAPSITSQPAAQNTTLGSDAGFTVVAAGTAPLSYQWRRSGVPLSDGAGVAGATTDTLTLTGVSSADAATYDVIVTNSLGSVTSSAAALTVTAPPPAVIYWSFETASATTNATSDVTASDVTQHNNNGTTAMITNASVSSGYTGASGTYNAGAAARTGALVTGANGSAYFEVTLSPVAGKRLVLDGLQFGSRSTSTGPQAYAIFSSVDGYAAPFAGGALFNTGKWSLTVPAFASLTGAIDTPVTLRIYGYNGTGSATTGTANWRIDDLSIAASTVYPPPVAPVVTGTFPAPGAVNVDVTAPITITFNEAVSFTGSWFSITSARNGPTSAAVTGGPTTFTITPPSALPYGDTVTVTVFGAKVVDQASGTIHGAGNTTFSFGTGVYVPPTPPSVTQQPVSTTVTAGDSASFTVAASGTAPFGYQWRKDGAVITGNPSAITPTLTLASVTTADAGAYDCIVTNVAGSALSGSATLTVMLVPPSLTTQPTSQMTVYGGSVAFTATATGTGPLAYRWRHNGTMLSDGSGVSGAATATLTVSNVTLDDNGTYDVIVANAATSAVSSPATLAVTDSPSLLYWDFASADPTSGIPANLTGGTVSQGNNNGTTPLLSTTSASGSYAGASGGNNVGAAARIGGLNQAPGGSAYFEFTLTPSAGRQLAVTGFSFGTRSTGTGPQAFAVYSSVDNFAAPLAGGSIPNNSAWRYYSPSFAGAVGAAGQAVTFRLYGYNGAGGAGTNTANWRIDDLKVAAGVLTAPVSITVPPQAQTATVGDSVTLSVTAAGSAPYTYQWRKAGAPIAGATNSTLQLPSVVVADSGTYDVVVANIAATVTSAPAMLTVNKAVASVTLGNLNPTYDGQPHPVSVATLIGGLAVDVTYDGGAQPPVNAGSYAVVATIRDDNYLGSATGTLVINRAPATVDVANLTQTYDGAAKAASVTTSPAGLSTSTTYDGAAQPPTNAGTYAVFATITNPNYVGTTSGTLVINKAPATLVLSGLVQSYDGLPKPVTVTTAPEGLTVVLTYGDSETPPTLPGTYPVVATVSDRNYSGLASGSLRVGITALIRHAPSLNGGLDGSLQVLSPENLTLNSKAWVSGDVLVPGTPTVRANGKPTLAGVIDGTGDAAPSDYSVTLNGGAVMRYLFRRTNAIALPDVVIPPAPAGTRTVRVNGPTDPVGDFATVRDLTLNGSAGAVAVPGGSYGAFTANGGVLVLGVAGSSEPVVYNLQSLVMNGGASIRLLGPVVINVANAVTIAGDIGAELHPEWLSMNIAEGGLTLNGNASISGSVVAPTGSVVINGASTLAGGVSADRLVINGNGILRQP